jgi:hypothetical protein
MTHSHIDMGTRQRSLPCLPAEREEQGSSSSFITGAERDVKSREEQRGMEEKQRVTRSSRGWRPGGAGVAAAAPAEEGQCPATVQVWRHRGEALQLSSNPRGPKSICGTSREFYPRHRCQAREPAQSISRFRC